MLAEEVLTGKRIAVVLAHPDDELLWCGNMINDIDADWNILLCSDTAVRRADYAPRMTEFAEVCKRLKCKGQYIKGAPDSMDENDFGIDYAHLICSHLDTLDINIILTHNVNDRHVQHRHVGFAMYLYSSAVGIPMYYTAYDYDLNETVQPTFTHTNKINPKDDIGKIYQTGIKYQRLLQYKAFTEGIEGFKQI